MDVASILTGIITSATVATAVAAIAQKYFTSKIELRQQEKLEAIKGQINRRYQEEIELIKGRLAADLEQFKYVNSSLSGVYLSSNQERVAALKSAWELYLEAKEQNPAIVIMVCSYFTKEEVLNIKIFNGKDVQKMISEFDDMKYINAVAPINKQIEKLKPLIGLELWGLLSTYTTIIGRISLETGQVILKDYYKYYWLEDKHLIDNIITKIMPREKLIEVVNKGLLKGLLDYIELEIVEHINSQLTGKVFSLAQVQLAANIKNSADSVNKKDLLTP